MTTKGVRCSSLPPCFPKSTAKVSPFSSVIIYIFPPAKEEIYPLMATFLVWYNLKCVNSLAIVTGKIPL